MKLYIMRHGDAVPAQALQADAIRPLSMEGEQEVLVNAQWLVDRLAESMAKPQLDWVITSPYIRAQQTATVLHSLVPSKEQSVSEDITPEGTPAVFVDWLGLMLQRNPMEHALVVSHMPFVSYLVGEIDKSIQPPIFPTAGIAVIEFEPSTGRGKLENLVVADFCA